MMIALSVLTFMFIYSVWWVAIFTAIVAAAGYYAAEVMKLEDSTQLSQLNLSHTKQRSKRQTIFAEFVSYL